MKHFYIVVNAEKKMASHTRQTVESILSVMDGVTFETWDGPRQGHYDLPEDTDCIITIGGDGTLIQTARATVGSGIPILGINRGHLGYLTELQKEEDIEPALRRLVADDYRLESRMMLDADVKRDGKAVFHDIALNEALLGRQNALRAIDFCVYVNGRLLNEYCADGIMIATPTGSTAYSLSAGGPIAKPQAQLMIMTPICSHAVNARSIILSPGDIVTFVPKTENQLLSCDGDSVESLLCGDEVVIRRSAHTTKLVRLENESFLDTLRNKMTSV